jgi:uncharacterized membrane protein
MAIRSGRRAGDFGLENFEGMEGFGAGRPGERRRQEWGGRQTKPAEGHAEQLARFLGWFSVGLGLAAVLAPRQLADLIGVGYRPRVFRLMGVREIGHGVSILSQEEPAAGIWFRVAGDILDLSLLSSQLNERNPERAKTLAATLSVLGVTALDLFTARSLRSDGGNGRSTADTVQARKGIRVQSATTVARPVTEVYQFWRNFENLPRFMSHLESVQVVDARRSHWTALGPVGIRLEWDAETVEDRPNELISWRSLPGGQVDTAGYVRFRPAPGNRGTEIMVELRYDPPGGAVGATIAKLFGESGQEVVSRDLRAFKNVLETGEVVQSESSIYPRPHSAQPPDESELEKARLLKKEGAVR